MIILSVQFSPHYLLIILMYQILNNRTYYLMFLLSLWSANHPQFFFAVEWGLWVGVDDLGHAIDVEVRVEEWFDGLVDDNVPVFKDVLWLRAW